MLQIYGLFSYNNIGIPGMSVIQIPPVLMLAES